jgi:hypothetical protein
MNRLIRFVFVLPVLVVSVLSAGCSSYKNVPPQFYGRKLNPTGWEDKIYTPGQVDIGDLGQTGQGNSLVLIQVSAFEVKEAFVKENEDKEDHRVTMGDETPMTLDVRLVFTSPDIEKAVNKKEATEQVKRLFTLGNPSPTKEDRVLILSLQSIYEDLARLNVRSRIRDLCAGYKGFSEAFKAKTELSKKIKEVILAVLKEKDIPLILLDCEISNMKPDPLVWENQVKIQAAQAEIEAMRMIEEYVAGSPVRQFIYKMGKMKEIAQVGPAKGNTVVILSDISSQAIAAGLESVVQPKK